MRWTLGHYEGLHQNKNSTNFSYQCYVYQYLCNKWQQKTLIWLFVQSSQTAKLCLICLFLSTIYSRRSRLGRTQYESAGVSYLERVMGLFDPSRPMSKLLSSATIWLGLCHIRSSPQVFWDIHSIQQHGNFAKNELHWARQEGERLHNHNASWSWHSLHAVVVQILLGFTSQLPH